MGLHPLGGLDEEVHLLGLLVALLLHDGGDLVALLALLEPLLVLVLDQRQLVVRLVELLIRRLLLPRLVLHLHVVRGQVLRVQAIRLLVLIAKFVLVGLVLGLDLVVVAFEGVDLLLERGDFSDVSVFDLFVHLFTSFVQLIDFLVTVRLHRADRRVQTLYLGLSLRLLLSDLLLVLLEVLLL